MGLSLVQDGSLVWVTLLCHMTRVSMAAKAGAWSCFITQSLIVSLPLNQLSQQLSCKMFIKSYLNLINR